MTCPLQHHSDPYCILSTCRYYPTGILLKGAPACRLRGYMLYGRSASAREYYGPGGWCRERRGPYFPTRAAAIAARALLRAPWLHLVRVVRWVL